MHEYYKNNAITIENTTNDNDLKPLAEVVGVITVVDDIVLSTTTVVSPAVTVGSVVTVSTVGTVGIVFGVVTVVTRGPSLVPSTSYRIMNEPLPRQ